MKEGTLGRARVEGRPALTLEPVIVFYQSERVVS